MVKNLVKLLKLNGAATTNYGRRNSIKDGLNYGQRKLRKNLIFFTYGQVKAIWLQSRKVLLADGAHASENLGHWLV